MTSDLPTEFDFVVLGTGLPEAILAAAFSRNGYKVLHLDRNDHYSDKWASFNLRGIEKFAQQNETKKKEANVNIQHQEGERLVHLSRGDSLIEDLKVRYYVPEDVMCEMVDEDLKRLLLVESDTVINDTPTDIGKVSSVTQIVEEDTKKGSAVLSNSNEKTSDHSQGIEAKEDIVTETDVNSDVKNDTPIAESSSNNTSNDHNDQQIPQKKKIWTKKDLEESWRYFNIDLAPKVLYSSGKMVDLLISSDVAKYCEFKTISRILRQNVNELKKVPCSRADVFSSKELTMLDKRKLMKFLEWCAGYDKNPEAYAEYVNQPIHEVLKSRNIPEKLQDIICHAIAMVTPDCATKKALDKVKLFLQSVGRYGNTPFLFPLYGSGELPQAFCRLCAVFGGIYCLDMSADAMIINGDNKCEAIITSEGQRISCKWLIMGSTYSPDNYVNKEKRVSRCVLFTDRSILHSKSQELSMLWLPPGNDVKHPVTVLELPQSAMVCPKDIYVVHLTMEGTGNPEADFSPIINQYFSTDGQTRHDTEGEEKPAVLWSGYFSQWCYSVCENNCTLPEKVFILDGPNTDIHMDEAVLQAKTIFEQVCPGDIFLPKPPHPDDIIYVNDAEATVGGGETWDGQKDNKDKTSEEIEGNGIKPEGQEGKETEVKTSGEKGDSGVKPAGNEVKKAEVKTGKDEGGEIDTRKTTA